MTIISKRKTHITMAVLFVFLIFLDQLTKKIASMYLIGNDVTIIFVFTNYFLHVSSWGIGKLHRSFLASLRSRFYLCFRH